MLKKIVVVLWFLAFLLLFLYSFTQVDLGLTLTRASFFQGIQKSFQYIGYFNRPLSAQLVSILFCILFTLYCFTLWSVKKKKISVKTIWVVTILGAIILLGSYNAFSYDLFNYVFDAKIVTHYHSNPYIHKALDYPQDPMLGFMHWTHRTYPYGPSWLGLTVPLSYLGFGYFLVTLFLFKTLMVSCYLASCYLIYKIAKHTKIIDPVFALTFFALNPFVLVESLVSAHNDIVMMALTLGSVYMIIQGKKYRSWLFLVLSIGIKFATALLIPLVLWYPFSKQKNKNFLFFLGAIILMCSGVYMASLRTNFQPWYFLLVLPFSAFLSHKYYVGIPTAVFSFLILFQYIPYFYTGNYDAPIPFIMNQMLLWSIGLSVVISLLFGLYKKMFLKK